MLADNPSLLRTMLDLTPPWPVIKAGYDAHKDDCRVMHVRAFRGQCIGHGVHSNKIYIGRGTDSMNPLYHGNGFLPRDFNNILSEEPDGLIVCIRLRLLLLRPHKRHASANRKSPSLSGMMACQGCKLGVHGRTFFFFRAQF